LEIHCEGSEFIDLNWVSSSYHADCSPISTSGRKLERRIFRASAVRQPNSILSPSTKQRFYVSLRLPEAIPPSFRGTASRFSYHMRVNAIEVAPRGVGITSPNEPSPFYPANGLANGVELPPHTVRVPFTVWPPPSGSRPRSSFDAPSASAGFQLPQGFFGDGGVAVVNYQVGIDPANCSIQVTEVSQEDPNFSVQIDQACSAPSQGRSPRVSLRHNDGSGGLPPGSEAQEEPPPSEADTEESMAGRLQSHLALDNYTPTPGTATAQQQAAVRSYNLKIGEYPLVKFSLNSSQEGQIYLGCTLSGMLDFQCSHGKALSEPTPRCVQVVVQLETEECLNPVWLASKRVARSELGIPTVRKVYDEHLELTQDTLLTHFMFTLPSDAPASFATPLVVLRWVLRFELTALRIGEDDGRRTVASHPPERLSWVLPLFVHPPNSARR